MSIYLDFNATTPLDGEVLAAMLPFFSEKYGNPSSQYLPGREAKKSIEHARSLVADAIGASGKEIIFTSGGTEANNIAIQGVARMFLNNYGIPGHIISNRVEHSCVLNTLRYLEQSGWEVSYIDVDQNGVISPENVESAIKEKTCLISIMLANNETGVIQNLAKITEFAHQAGIIVHSDAVQAVGKISVDIKPLGIDLLSLSAHKFHGPKGAGALFIKDRLPLLPILFGGGQERSLKPGTENVPGIVGLGAAIDKAVNNLNNESQKSGLLIDSLKAGIIANIADVRINGCSEDMLKNTLNVSFAGIDAISLHSALDRQGIFVGTGAACSSSTPEISHVLKGMKIPPEYAFSAIRFSVGRNTVQSEIDAALKTLISEVARLRGEENNGSCCGEGCCSSKC